MRCCQSLGGCVTAARRAVTFSRNTFKCRKRSLACYPSHRFCTRQQPPEIVNDSSNHITKRMLLTGLSISTMVWMQPCRQAGAADEQEDFYMQWSYSGPSDILPFLYANSQQSDTDSILAAMDKFSSYYPMYSIGPEKGRILEDIVRHVQPRVIVELGSFLGYSAIRITRNLQHGEHLVCVEASPEAASTMAKVLSYAGLQDKVTILQGVASDMVPAIQRACNGAAQLIFEDHAKQCYTPDLQFLEDAGVVAPGSWVVADNVAYPGAPGFVEHLNAGGYSAVLLPARYEYDQPWNPSWEPKQDAMVLALRQPAASKAQPELTSDAAGGNLEAAPSGAAADHTLNDVHEACSHLPVECMPLANLERIRNTKLTYAMKQTL